MFQVCILTLKIHFALQKSMLNGVIKGTNKNCTYYVLDTRVSLKTNLISEKSIINRLSNTTKKMNTLKNINDCKG